MQHLTAASARPSGYMDADGYLYINGRSKEVINRGGEIISPFEVEEACLTHPGILNLICFAQPHDTLQEGIGIAVLVRPGHARPDLRSIQQHVGKALHPSKWPQMLVYMDTDLPKGPGSGKPQRSYFADRAGAWWTPGCAGLVFSRQA